MIRFQISSKTAAVFSKRVSSTAWVYVAFEGNQALDMACRFQPDVIFLDVMLPGMNGFEICKKLKDSTATRDIPVIMLTVLNDIEDRIRGFNVGADVFLSKPIIYQELRNRVTWAINFKKTFSDMENKSQVVKSLLNMMQLKDSNLRRHACTVKDYCEKVAKILFVSGQAMDRLLVGAYLHDVGKVISTAPDEHVEFGLNIIAPLKMGDWLKVFVRHHHEKLNGQGFPDGLTANEMTLELKILITVNRFVEIMTQTGDKDASIIQLYDESSKGHWSREVLEAIKQVLKDEKFIRSIQCGN